MHDPYTEFTKHVLPNGLEVHSVFWDRPWIGVEIVVHSGGREDLVTKPGLAHFVEHVVSKNIPKWEYAQSREFFEVCGGRANFGMTSYLSTIYKFAVPAEPGTFHEALTIFGLMLLEAQIKDNIERERNVILREFNERYPFLEKLNWDMDVRSSLFPEHRLETWNRPLGRPEGFMEITKKDLQDFYDKHYTPANMSLVVVGGLKTKDVISELKKGPFGDSKDGKRNPVLQQPYQIPNPQNNYRTVKLSDHVNFRVDQTEYMARWAFPADFPWQSCRVFNKMLKHLLFEEIRQKQGLTYSISTHYALFQDVNEYEIVSRVSPNATNHINELVRRCIEMVPSERNVFERKLESSKRECLMLDLSGQDLADDSANDLALKHQIIPQQESWDQLHKVTFEQMIEATSLLSTKRQYTFITCP